MRTPALLTLLLATALPAAADPAFERCLDGLRPQAAAAGIRTETFDLHTAGLVPDPTVLESLDFQPEFRTPIWDYLAGLVDQERVDDGKAMLAKTVAPNRKDRQWELELAPLTRMSAWNVEEIKPGAAVSAIGFTFKDEKGDAVMRVEYLFVAGKAYGRRSSPA